jgi:L-type amino acid transporter 6
MSSEEVRLLEESHQPHHQENPNDEEEEEEEQDDDDDNGADNSDGFLDGSSPQHLETGFPNPPRSLTFVNGLAITIGLQIGSGIFSAPAAVRINVSTSAAALSVWIFTGILVWMGAAAFIELGTRIPHNGGMQEYLRHCYGDVYGFLFAWAWILLSRSCAMAMISLVFSEYLFKTVSPDHDVDVWVLKGTALLAITSITLLNFMGTNVGTSVANFFLVLKIFALSTITVTGVAFAVGGFTRAPDVSPPAAPDPGDSSLWTDVGGFTDAVLASLFAYGGCESVSAKLRALIRERSGLMPRLVAWFHCWRDERPTSHTTASHP